LLVKPNAAYVSLYDGGAYVFRRAAGYVDKIPKGVKPADLPVSAADQVRAGHQLQDAKALGLPSRTSCSPSPTS
jgi:hypothetical protein